eukprot:TRINITY_DN4543_c0_g1_i5.p1 TRINITY_DN4543_c0_g1~~TRINITY_DN4543_c0_g1_i5.p1  ORF type:complete len:1158 (+),score=259.94 TRINITY_DN4543_c0_g1_i5:107-3580(+)
MPIPIPPKVFSGRLSKDNEGALDWGKQNLIAFGCQSYVVTVDPVALEVIQTLDEHRAHVTAVKWSTEDLHNDLDKPFRLKLASGDKIGCVIVWNVAEASVLQTLQDPATKQQQEVIDLQWYPRDPNMLIALHLTSLVMWNAVIGTKQWRMDLTNSIRFLCFDPFDLAHVAMASPNGFIYFFKEFKAESLPPLPEHKYTINTARPTTPASPQNARNSSNVSEVSPPSDFQQMHFSPHTRNIIYFLLSREVLVFDLGIHQAIGSVSLERSRSSFSEMLLCRNDPNTFFCLHEDGSLSAWCKRLSDYKYELKCFSDTLRLSKNSKKKGVQFYGLVHGLASEKTLASVTNDGTVWLWNYTKFSHDWKFCVSGLGESISSSISSLCVSPFSQETESLIALGTYNGTLQLIDMVNSRSVREYTMWNQAVRCVRWLSPTSIMAFYCEEVGKNEYKNRLAILDLKTGKHSETRVTNGTENTFIRGIRVSSAKNYFIILLKDRPFELWDMKKLTLLRIMKPYSQVTALEWAPLKATSPFEKSAANEVKVNKEEFIFTLPDGSLHYFSVEEGVVNSSEMLADLGSGIVLSLAWKNDFIVAGDTIGTLHCWNTRTKTSQVFSTNKGLIRRIRFSPSPQTHQIMVLFNEGDFGIWDIDHNTRVSVSSYLKGRDLRVIDCDWITENTPIVATSDGSVRILDRSLSISNSPLSMNSIRKPIVTPLLLPFTHTLHLKVLLQHSIEPGKFSYEPATTVPSFDAVLLQRDEQNAKRTPELALVDYVNKSFLSEIHAASSITQRCLLIAKFYGSDNDIKFWTLATWAFDRFSSKGEVDNTGTKQESALNNSVEFSHIIITEEEINQQKSRFEAESQMKHKETISPTQRLPPWFDLLLENDVIREVERERAVLHEKKKEGYELTKKVAEFNLLLGEKQKAVDLLMETPYGQPLSLVDGLKAAVISASISPDSFNNTVKLIATNLIANGNLDEGVQLLCLIGKSLDACRYLQSYDRWADAAWLAKVTLQENECAVVMRRWAQFLIQSGQKIKAVQILLTLGEFHQVLQLLHEAKDFDTAALFLSACNEKGFLRADRPDETPSRPSSSSFSAMRSMVPLEQLAQAVHLEYGAFLQRLGNTTAAEFYFRKAGPAGESMLETMRAEKLGRKSALFLRNTQ